MRGFAQRRALSAGTSIAPPACGVTAMSTSAGSARILIVDDDETVLQTFAKALTLEGYDVRIAASPLTGLQQVEDTPPDAILLDLRMPFVNGIGFLYRLRAQAAHRHTPVAIITGDSCIDDPMLEEVHELDAEVLFKPIWIEDVVKLTRSMLAKRATHH
jgi:DNA-binding response OmpR family regulator